MTSSSCASIWLTAVRQIDVNVEPVQLLRQMTDDIVQCVNASVETAVFYFNEVGRRRPVCERDLTVMASSCVWTRLDSDGVVVWFVWRCRCTTLQRRKPRIFCCQTAAKRRSRNARRRRRTGRWLLLRVSRVLALDCRCRGGGIPSLRSQ